MSCGIVITSAAVLVEHGNVLLKKNGPEGCLRFHCGILEDYSQTLIKHVTQDYDQNLRLRICVVDPIPYIVYTAKEEPGKSLDIFIAHFNATRLNETLSNSDLEWVPLDRLNEKKLLPDVLPTLKHFGYIS
jgi:hypothetical protein